MSTWGLVFCRFYWVLALLLWVLPPKVNTQTLGCSIQGIDLQPCLNLTQYQSREYCCKALDQVIKAGYYCLCSLLTNANPLLSTPLALEFSNCYISAPPLAHCRVTTAPMVLPPIIPMEPSQPSAPQMVVAPVPPQDARASLNLTQDQNLTMITEKPNSRNETDSTSNTIKRMNEKSYGEDNPKRWWYGKMLLIVAFYACIL